MCRSFISTPSRPSGWTRRCTISALSRMIGKARPWARRGWEVWCDGMEITQFTYFQQVGGIECDPVAAEITYGLERLAMYVQNVEFVYDLAFKDHFCYGEVFHQNEQEFSAYNFERADPEILFQHFKDAEKQCRELLSGEKQL